MVEERGVAMGLMGVPLDMATPVVARQRHQSAEVLFVGGYRYSPGGHRLMRP